MWQDVGGVFYFKHRDGSAIPGARLPVAVINSNADMFVIEVFKDAEGRFILFCYGFGWKGTMAAGLYFDKVVYPDLASNNVGWVIVRWNDTNADGLVNALGNGDGYTVVAQGI